MKLRVILSILFLIVTTLSAVHELEHIVNDEGDSACLVYHVHDNLTPIDVIDEIKDIEIFHDENILQNTQVTNLHIKNKSNPNRAPPSIS